MRYPDVPIPDRMQHLRLDSRGFPVPFFLDNGDATDFRAMNAPHVFQAIKDRLCGVCGKPLGYFMVFMGGPKSCENGVFTDPPFHAECADYSTRVCPFIVHAGWSRSHLETKEPSIRERDPAGTLERYEMHRYLTRGYEIFQTSGGGMLFRARPPLGVQKVAT